MVFIGAYWWLWTVLTVIFIGYASYNQINRIMGMKKKGFDQKDMDGAFQAFGSGIKGFVIACILGGISTFLALLSVAINLIAFAAH
jgi:uncharacterized membrane protein YhaH (DUF805 family)